MTASMDKIQQDIISFTYAQAQAMAGMQKALGDDDVGDIEEYASQQVAELLKASEEVAREAGWPDTVIHAFTAGMITSICNMLGEALDSAQQDQ